MARAEAMQFLRGLLLFIHPVRTGKAKKTLMMDMWPLGQLCLGILDGHIDRFQGFLKPRGILIHNDGDPFLYCGSLPFSSLLGPGCLDAKA